MRGPSVKQRPPLSRITHSSRFRFQSSPLSIQGSVWFHPRPPRRGVLGRRGCSVGTLRPCLGQSPRAPNPASHGVTQFDECTMAREPRYPTSPCMHPACRSNAPKSDCTYADNRFLNGSVRIIGVRIWERRWGTFGYDWNRKFGNVILWGFFFASDGFDCVFVFFFGKRRTQGRICLLIN